MTRLALLLAMALVVVAPASARAALNVTLTATPSSGAVVGSPVRLAATSSSGPTLATSIVYKFSVARDPSGEPVAASSFIDFPAWPWTPSAGGSYMLIVTVEARDSARRVLDTGSASIRNYSVLFTAPGIAIQPGQLQLLLLNPYTLEVSPHSFAATSGLPGGIIPRSQTQRPSGGPHATTDTTIKLEAKLKPGLTEAPVAQRRCLFEAVAADGSRAFTQTNHCEPVETKLLQGTFTLRLGYGTATTPPASFSFVELRNYLVYQASQFAPVTSTVPGATGGPNCASPCVIRTGICVWPGQAGGGIFVCPNSDRACGTNQRCIDSTCWRECFASPTPCPSGCGVSAGVCVKTGFQPFQVNRFCSTNADCDSGNFCLAGACKVPC